MMNIIEELEKLKLAHYVNDEDNWYSCPMSGQCSNDNAAKSCKCGAEKHNAMVESIIAALKEKGSGG